MILHTAPFMFAKQLKTIWAAFLLLLMLSVARPVQAVTTYIDILLVYDNTATSWVSSNGGMYAFSQDVVNRMNQATQNSGIDLTFRLAHQMGVNYTTTSGPSSPLSGDLTALQGGAGVFAAVHTARNTYGADVVAMLVDHGSASGYVGVGYMLNTWSGSPNGAFTVNAIRAVDTGHTLTHEVGHNLGAHHAKNQLQAPGPNSALSTYSAGWYLTGINGTKYHTIMAYDTDGYGGYYQEAPVFSTPLLAYQGATAGHALNGDNARMIRETMGIVAAYRQSVQTTVPVCSSITPPSAIVTVGSASPLLTATCSNSPTAYVWKVGATTLTSCTGATCTVPAGNLPAVGAYNVTVRANNASGTGTVTAGATITVAANDNFPPGGSLPPGWTQPVGSNAPWFVTNDTAYSGSLSLRSGAISHSQQSEISYTGTFQAGTVSFARKVSSEANWDFLEFYIDGVLRTPRWSGEVNWSVVSFPITAGTHTLKWRYFKDISNSPGSDAAWIDSVTLPVTAPQQQAPRYDFNGDGKADILWRNTATGDNTVWFMNGATRTSATATTAATADWNAAQVADFNGDGKADILWRNAAGQNTIWLMNGATRTSATAIPAAAAPWTIAGAGDFNGDGKADILWRNTATGANAIWFMNGATRTSAAATTAATVDWNAAQVADFNGDGKADILWRNAAGQNTIWLMNGATRTSATAIPAAAAPWTIAGAGDFNGDGKADILWRNTATGDNTVWFMNGATRTSAAATTAATADWNAAQVADFNGDGKADILWRNAAGQNTIWLMNGATRTSATAIPAAAAPWTIAGAGGGGPLPSMPACTGITPSPAPMTVGSSSPLLTATCNNNPTAYVWKIGATTMLCTGATCTVPASNLPLAGTYYVTVTANNASGTGTQAASATLTVTQPVPQTVPRYDFNGDGKADILWRNTATGDNTVWFMNGATRNSAVATTTVAPSWSVAQVADFNGDGRADILWRNAAGQNTIWLMNGATRTSATAIPAAAAPWTIAGAGDFNGDGKADILWRNTATGDNAIWFMNGATRTSATATTAATADWNAAQVADFNGDGKADILWRNAAGQNTIWLMNGATRTSATAIPAAAAPWTIAGAGDFNGDGKADILWRNTATGANAIWFMNGATRTSAAATTAATVDWNAAQVADFNGDGKADILWRNAAGQNVIWLMNGSTLGASVAIAAVAAPWAVMPGGATDPLGAGRIAAGYLHTCALTSGGAVKCWGDNSSGQLGDNSTTLRLTPVNVTNLTSGVVSIAAGDTHTCALTSGGAVKCWGDNRYGQLGDNSTINKYTPVNVTGLASGVVAITAGVYHTCALTSGGAVKCWGWNGNGQLGDNSTIDKYTPVNVTGLASGVVAITAGAYHTCALTSGGAVKCWGNNFDGQLGDNSTIDKYTPVNVSGLTSGASAIAGGDFHTCALTSSGAVKCWGDNSSGQLGDNSTINKYTPVNVTGLASGVVAITAGNAHTCALTSGGAVKCWGNNLAGQLGDDSTVNKFTPVNVTGLSSGVVEIDAGIFHTCAMTGGGTVKCWGNNLAGQLGVNSTVNKFTPVNVIGL